MSRGDAFQARATHAPHRARILGLGLSVGIAIAAAGCAPDPRAPYEVVALDDMAVSPCWGEISAVEYREIREIVAAYPDARDVVRGALADKAHHIDPCERSTILAARDRLDTDTEKHRLASAMGDDR